MTSTETASNPTTAARPAPAGPVDPLGSDIIGLLRSLKLSGMKDTLPERLSLARTRQMGHAAFLELHWNSCSPTRSPAAMPAPRPSGRRTPGCSR